MSAIGRSGSVLALAMALVVPGALTAQDEEMGAAPPAANTEPGTLDILNEQTSLGNVAQAGRNLYHSGRRDLVRAMKMEEKLPEIDAGKREKQLAKIEKAYQKAADTFVQAIRTSPNLLEAYTELGQAYRALGKHAEAVQVHNAALKMAPEDVDNLYGRGEAFLALNYLREAATTYTELAGDHQEHADKLMASLKQWVSDHREDPGEIRAEAIETLAAWIEQQESGESAGSG